MANTEHFRIEWRYQGATPSTGCALECKEFVYWRGVIEDLSAADEAAFAATFSLPFEAFFAKWQADGLTGSELAKITSDLRKRAFSADHLGEMPIESRLAPPREAVPGVLDTAAGFFDFLRAVAGAGGSVVLVKVQL